jgi:hypothetical protein
MDHLDNNLDEMMDLEVNGEGDDDDYDGYFDDVE